MPNYKSQAQQNQEAVPPVINDPPAGASEIRQFIVTLSTGDNANGEITELIRLPARTRLYDLQVMRAAHTGATDVSIGLRFPSQPKGGDPVQISANADECINDSSSFSGAANTWGFFASAGGVSTFTPANVGKMLWELAGLTADPLRDMCVIILWNVGTTAAGPFASAWRFTVSGEN